jgi:hypothetical protein
MKCADVEISSSSVTDYSVGVKLKSTKVSHSPTDALFITL